MGGAGSGRTGMILKTLRLQEILTKSENMIAEVIDGKVTMLNDPEKFASVLRVALPIYLRRIPLLTHELSGSDGRKTIINILNNYLPKPENGNGHTESGDNGIGGNGRHQIDTEANTST